MTVGQAPCSIETIVRQHDPHTGLPIGGSARYSVKLQNQTYGKHARTDTGRLSIRPFSVVHLQWHHPGIADLWRTYCGNHRTLEAGTSVDCVRAACLPEPHQHSRVNMPVNAPHCSCRGCVTMRLADHRRRHENLQPSDSFQASTLTPSRRLLPGWDLHWLCLQQLSRGILHK